MKWSSRTLFVFFAILGLACVGIWVGAGLKIGRARSVSADEIAHYVNSMDLARLSGPARSAALLKLEEEVNALSLEERRKWWVSGEWRTWFGEMTENEKGQYIDATLPTGFKQVLNAFEDLPDDRRSRAIDEAMRQLKATHRLVTDREPAHSESMYGTNPPPVLSPELENRARMVGFKTFYVESSAQTKAELAPLVEELQNQLETGPRAGQ